ncbi:MAG: M50 family metallopeptidase [Clostridia bacterium]|nr:M50 family metallopeptidase [Clostridia bacterium]
MEGEDEFSEEKGSFSKASFWKKLAIVLAGPIVNIAFGLIIYFILVAVNYGLQVAWENTVGFIEALFDSIKTLITGGAGMDDLAGPVGIANIVSKTSGLTDFIYLLAVISLSLGITNLIPIPPLDRRKTSNIYYRMDKKKAIKDRNIPKNTNAWFCVYNRTFNCCHV